MTSEPKKWNPRIVEEAINQIYEYTLNNFDPKNYWPTHPDEDTDIEINKTFYNGACGTLWGLDQISKYQNSNLPISRVDIINQIHSDYIFAPDTMQRDPSLFVGEVGILLTKYLFSPSQKVEDSLHELIDENIKNKTMEPLWGASGTMLAALYLYRKHGTEKWMTQYLKNSNFLIQELKRAIKNGDDLWTQDMYGQSKKFTGAGHGYFGNVFAILKGRDLLSNDDREFILEHAAYVLKKYAIEFNGAVNWPPVIPVQEENKLYNQWCHGSAGIVMSLKNYPINHDPEVELLLLKAGESVWREGPLDKGIALCHGTDGNGFALLQLYQRTGDKMWLDRARSFAMYAITQRNGRFTLFTGELGLAIYLVACIKERGDFPLLDYL